MRYGSVCSGIEAASVAWHPLGWSASWLAEIEPFPCSVLKHHYPDVENLGDMTQIAHLIRDGFVEAPDVLVGGTPCQAFSIAGLRNSLDDKRGQLTLSFVDLANAIDTTRLLRGERESIILWENVPGVLSTKDNAFGCFLAALSGEDEAFKVPGGRWSNAGCVFGPQRTVAWRTLDAQYFGVAQRRRRVFVVASARKDINPTEILFEFDGVRRDFAPSREAGQEVAGTITSGAFGGGAGGRPEGAAAGHFHPVISKCLTRNSAGGANLDFETADFIASTFSCGGIGACDSSSVSATLLKTGQDLGPGCEALITYGIPGNWIGRAPENGGNATEPMNDIAPCLTETDRHAVCASSLIGAFKGGQGAKAGGIGFDHNISPTLSAADSGSNRVPVIAFDARQDCISSAEVFGSLSSSSPQSQAVASTPFEVAGTMLSRTTSGGFSSSIDHAAAGYMAIQSMQVRRLTPVECARLQGFPDDYLNVIHRGKPAADGNKYKALGNSMAVPVMAWIGFRIDAAVKSC